MEAVLILIAIALGYMEGRPFTASKLAAYLDTPRTSVLRKLAQLKREGFVASADIPTFSMTICLIP